MAEASLGAQIKKSHHVVFFGGAGVSTESNIPDFRSGNGLYSTTTKDGRSPEDMLSFSFFKAHPEEFFDFFRRNLVFPHAKPNKAHHALAELEKRGALKAVITQNVDGLHQAAGSSNVLELHGSINRCYCMDCGTAYSLGYVMDLSRAVPKCSQCGGIVRPDVTMYEEQLDMDILDRAVSYVRAADLLMVGGTSLAVYPAAGLIDYFSGNSLVLINRSETPYDSKATLVLRNSIGEELHEAVFGQREA